MIIISILVIVLLPFPFKHVTTGPCILLPHSDTLRRFKPLGIPTAVVSLNSMYNAQLFITLIKFKALRNVHKLLLLWKNACAIVGKNV